MSDLSTLFLRPQPSYTKLNPIIPSAPMTSHQTIKPNPVSWSMKQLQSKLLQNMKSKLSEKNLDTELQLFIGVQKRELFHTAFLLSLCTLAISYCFQFDSRVTFHLILLLATELLIPALTRLTRQPLISTTLVAIRPLIYATLCYYLLKNLAGTDMNAPNHPFTVVTVILTSLNTVINYLSPLYLLQSKHLFFNQLKNKTFFKRMSFIPLFLWQKIKFSIKIRNYLIASSVICFIIATLVSWYLKISVKDVFQPLCLGLSVLVFVSLELFLEICRLTPTLLLVEVKSCKDKLPVVLSLLRISSHSELSTQVQRKCLLILYLRMQRVSCFLSTQTCKSLIHGNYMQIFNSYVELELESFHEKINKDLNSAQKANRIYNKNKSVFQDIFYPIRKVKAPLSQLHSFVNTLSGLLAESSLLRVIALADEQAFKEKDTVRVSTRIAEMLEIIQGKLNRLQECSIGNSIFVQEMQIRQREIKNLVFSIKNGWV